MTPQETNPSQEWEKIIIEEFRKAVDKQECEPLKIVQMIRSHLSLAREESRTEERNRIREHCCDICKQKFVQTAK